MITNMGGRRKKRGFESGWNLDILKLINLKDYEDRLNFSEATNLWTGSGKLLRRIRTRTQACEMGEFDQPSCILQFVKVI